jgi:hypothetical protein
MRKIGVLILLLLLTPLVAGFYGAVHDQITYTISADYFTKFKYGQFGFEPDWFGGHRQTVAVIGFLSAWWTGIPIGIINGLTGLIYRDAAIMFRMTFNSLGLILLVTVIAGCVGYIYGSCFPADEDIQANVPADVADKSAFIVVGTIHTFSYLGGVIGLISGVIYHIAQRRRLAGTVAGPVKGIDN